MGYGKNQLKQSIYLALRLSGIKFQLVFDMRTYFDHFGLFLNKLYLSNHFGLLRLRFLESNFVSIEVLLTGSSLGDSLYRLWLFRIYSLFKSFFIAWKMFSSFSKNHTFKTRKTNFICVIFIYIIQCFIYIALTTN